MPLDDDVNAYVEELNHAKRQGFKAVMVMGFPSGNTYPSVDDDPFWATAIDLDMPVTVHVDIERPKKGPLWITPRAPQLTSNASKPPVAPSSTRSLVSAPTATQAASSPPNGFCPTCSTASPR